MSGVRALDEEDLAPVVADHGADRDFRRDVTGHPKAHALHPFRPEFIEGAVPGNIAGAGRKAHVGGDVQDLLVPLPLVLALREPETGAGDAGEAFAPAEYVSMPDIGNRQ